MQTVQIFGLRNSPAARAAERFFKERRTPVQFIDLRQKPMAPGEIKRFIERFGLATLIDAESPAYQNAGMKYLKLAEAELLDRIAKEPKLLRLPLVRAGNRLSIGQDEKSWTVMLAGAGTRA